MAVRWLVCCLLFCCVLCVFFGRCALSVGCFCGVRCLLRVDCRLLSGVWCLLIVDRCMSVAVCCLLFVICCLRCVVSCLGVCCFVVDGNCVVELVVVMCLMCGV